MSRRKSWSDDDLRNAVRGSRYMSEVVRELGLSVSNGNFKTIHRSIDKLKIDTNHWIDRKTIGQEKGGIQPKYTYSEMLIENSQYTGMSSMKRRLIRDGLLQNECYICGQKGTWNGEKLVMVLDHINGINNDHRLENLRMLCPNCNSQKKTFAGRNKTKDPRGFCECGERKRVHSKMCKKCAAKMNRPRKVKNRPPIDVLKLQVEDEGWAATGRKYGVSDNAVRKWLK